MRERYRRIVLNEPHASVEGLYNPLFGEWKIDSGFINDVVVKWTDWHTDFLFHGAVSQNVIPVRFPYSRFIVDAERLWDDPLEAVGQGIVYRHFDGYTRAVDPATETRLKGLWKWHQHRLASRLVDGSLLLDCHSFPEHKGNVDICIGFNEDRSKPDDATIDMAIDLFESNGYSVGVNYPYSNSMTPRTDVPYHSMMLEVNKRIYLETDSIRLLEQPHGKRHVNEIFNELVGRLVV